MKNKGKLSLLIALLIAVIFNSPYVLAKPNRSAPVTPNGLTASNIGTSSVTLSWLSVSNASGYNVYMGSPNNSSFAKVTSVTGTSFTKSGLSSGTSYWFYVTAYNQYGASANSTHINVVTKIADTASKKKVLGFTTYYYTGDTSSYNSMTANTSSIDEIATQTYVTDSYGKLSGMVPASQIAYANNNGIKTYAMLQNNFDGNIAKSILENSAYRQTLENNILNALKANGYKGVNVDLEGVYYYDRSYYTTFVQELYNLLKPQGFSISLSVPAKTSDSATNSWNGAYDYAALAKYSDEITLMTYDEHYPGGSAGSIGSIGWVENVIKYAVTVIPREKIMLGVAAYGYDWSTNGTKAYSINGMYNLAAVNNAPILWDDVSKSPYFSYTDTSGIAHTDWFENSESVKYKLDLVNSYNLSGVSLWRLGLENPDYWTSIKTKFNK